MSTSVTNHLTISGNEQVKKFVKKLNEEFIKDKQKKNSDPNTAVRRLIYGHTNEVAEWLSRDPNTKYVYFYDETHWRPIDTSISLVSQSNTIEDIQDYLLVTLSRLDPFVLICNQYFNEYLTTITTRYSLMCDLAPDDIEIYTEVKVPKVENEAFYNRFDRIKLKDKEKAFKLLKKKFNWIKDDLYI